MLLRGNILRAFISYSHKDSGALDRLHVHLANLQREGKIETWYDRKILAGSVIDDDIDSELEHCDLFLLLISPDFIASDYCMNTEMQRALERHDEGSARVVPLIIEPCEWAAVQDLRRLKALPNDGLAVSEWTNPNNAYLNIVQELRKILTTEEVSKRTTSQGSTEEEAPVQTQPKYRIQKEFDEIDRGDFREASFEVLRKYFQSAIDEIDKIDELRGRYGLISDTCFGCVVVNRSKQNGTAHITVHRSGSGYSLGDIYYSFSENSPPNTANGSFNVCHDEYEQYLSPSLRYGAHKDRLTPDQAAEMLWDDFVEQAGITHA